MKKQDYSNHIKRNFFKRKPRDVATDLLSRLITRQSSRTNIKYGIIREVATWEGDTETSKETLEYAPGLIGISNRRGNYLIDIATGTQNEPSCITLTGIETPTGKIIRGPGKVSDYLQVNEMLNSAPIDHPSLWIGKRKLGIEPKWRKLSNMPKNWQGTCFY